MAASTPQWCSATKASRRGSGSVTPSPLPAPGPQPNRGKRRRGQASAVVADDGAEAVVLGVPLLRVVGDLLARPADEVPPHDDLLVERLATEEQQPGRLAGAQAQRLPVGAEVEHRAALEWGVLDRRRTRRGEHGVLEVGVE